MLIIFGFGHLSLVISAGENLDRIENVLRIQHLPDAPLYILLLVIRLSQ